MLKEHFVGKLVALDSGDVPVQDGEQTMVRFVVLDEQFANSATDLFILASRW